MDGNKGLKSGSKPILFSGFAKLLLIIALLMAAPMIYINIQRAGTESYRAISEKRSVSIPSGDSLYSAMESRISSALIDKFKLIESNVCQGFPPPNQSVVIEDAIENHTWQESNSSLKGVIDVFLKGHIENSNLIPTINVELGAHSRDDKLPITVTDRISGKTMEEGKRVGEWSRAKTEIIVNNSNKSVTHVAIHPAAHSKEREFDILISYQINKSKDDKLAAISIDPIDFGQDTLRSVSGTIFWPQDIYQQPYYFKWKHQVVKSTYCNRDSTEVIPEKLFSRNPLDFQIWQESTKEMRYKSIRPLTSCFAIMYKCQR